MKLTANNYLSPQSQQGAFKDVTIEDIQIVHKRQEKYLAIYFQMSYIFNGEKIILSENSLGFFGLNVDPNSSNRTITISVSNPDYDELIENSPMKVIVPMFEYMTNHGGSLPEIYDIADYGYPSYEDVLGYFTGGTFIEPEITMASSLAIAFLMNTLTMNGEKVIKQFTMDTSV